MLTEKAEMLKLWIHKAALSRKGYGRRRGGWSFFVPGKGLGLLEIGFVVVVSRHRLSPTACKAQALGLTNYLSVLLFAERAAAGDASAAGIDPRAAAIEIEQARAKLDLLRAQLRLEPLSIDLQASRARFE